MSFHHTRHVKRTRATRKCDWCWELINAGAPSVVLSGVFDGDFFSARYHPECETAIDRYYNTHTAWGESFPEDRMNRGGIEPYGEEGA